MNSEESKTTNLEDLESSENIKDQKPTKVLSKDYKVLADIRIAIVGNVDSGKSTLIGVLTNGGLDDGRGLARSRVFVHRHEENTGRTSCISQHIMGFDEKGSPVHQPSSSSASAVQKTKSWREVVSKSRNTLTMIDLAGHEKYLKTTIAGLTGSFPDFVIVVVGANAGLTKMTKEHLGVAISLNLPIICVVTKIDMCPAPVLKETKKQLNKILKSKGANKKPYVVNNKDDIDICISSVVGNESSQTVSKLSPIFFVSTVTGENLDLLYQYLSKLKPISNRWMTEIKEGEGVEFLLDETFVVTGVGLVVSGTVSQGTLMENSSLLLGPFRDGSFKKVFIKTIHCKRTPVPFVSTGNSCAVALRSVNRKEGLRRSDIRRGMVIVDPSKKPKAARKFKAEVLVLHHPTTIKSNYQAVVHCGGVRQTAAITKMEEKCLRTGDRALVEFKFMVQPEYLVVGQILIFREGNTKGVGRVLEVIKDEKANKKDNELT